VLRLMSPYGLTIR